MPPDHRLTPARIIGELLLNHPEAASLLAAATRWRSLAVWSAANARQKFATAQAARLAYEERLGTTQRAQAPTGVPVSA